MYLLNSAEKQALATAAQQRYSPAYLASWRDKCDPLADAVVASIASKARGVVPNGFSDLLSACEAAALAGDTASQQFMQAVQSVPDWVNFADFAAGQQLFRRNGIFTFLIGVSVLVASYGGYKDNKVLALSNRLGEGDSFRRAIETARFTLDVTAPDMLHVGEAGWRAILNVRLLHARVRQFSHRGGFPVELYDQPINQESMCGAVMLFSHGVIRALEILNVHVSELEKESYHALWRYAGWLMGVDMALLPLRHVEEEMLFEQHQYDYQPDADTDKLFNGTVSGIANGARTLPLWLTLIGGGLMRSTAFLHNFVGYTVNDTLRDYLGLRPNLFWRGVFGLIRLLQGAVSLARQVVPGFGRIQLITQAWLMEKIVVTLSADEPVTYSNTGLI